MFRNGAAMNAQSSATDISRLPPIHRLGGHPGPSPQAIENRPYKTYQTTPLVLHGPFLLDISETTAIVEWVTDTPCTAKVMFGESTEDQVAEPEVNGLIPVGTVHKVVLTGLRPGHTYRYKVLSTRVVRLNPYWPDKGLTLESSSYDFTTMDRMKSTVSFSLVTDTHEDVSRIESLSKVINWEKLDFLVHDGDGVNWLESEDQLFDRWIDPLTKPLDHSKPLLYARGNHDLRGPFARSLATYLGDTNDKFYFTRDDGPVHFIVLDTGEDKPDTAAAYAGLVRQGPYRSKELDWFQSEVKNDERMKTASFRIVLMHQPDFGWLDGKNREWTDTANEGKIDLVIAGHFHRFVHFPPGEGGNNFPVLVVAQDEVATVDASADTLHVTVTKMDGTVVETFNLSRRNH
jgi:predicted phosphodiesterase